MHNRSNTFGGLKGNDDPMEATTSRQPPSTNSTSKCGTEASGLPEQDHPWTEAEVKAALGFDPNDPTVSVRFERIDRPTPDPQDHLDRLVGELDKGMEAFHASMDDVRQYEVDAVLAEVGEELREAMVKHDPMRSAHEGYAVILEELDALWDEVKANRGYQRSARKEAIQVAAMAIRYILNVVR